MEKSSTIQKPFIHPSRAHLFQKPPVPDDTFKHTQIKVLVDLSYFAG